MTRRARLVKIGLAHARLVVPRRALILILVVGALLALPGAARANDPAIYQDLVIQSNVVFGLVSQLNTIKTLASGKTVIGRLVTEATSARRKIAADRPSTAAGATCRTRGMAIFAGYPEVAHALETGFRDASSSEIIQVFKNLDKIDLTLIATDKACAKLA